MATVIADCGGAGSFVWTSLELDQPVDQCMTGAISVSHSLSFCKHPERAHNKTFTRSIFPVSPRCGGSPEEDVGDIRRGCGIALRLFHAEAPGEFLY